MCRLTNNTSNSTNISHNDQHSHLFYKDLTSKFHQSCSAFISRKDGFDHRRHFSEEDDNNDNSSDRNNCFKDRNGNGNIVPFLNLVNQHVNHLHSNSSSFPSSSDVWMKDALQLSFHIRKKSAFLSQHYHLYTKQYMVLSTFESSSHNNNGSNSGGSKLTMSNDECHNFESNLVSFMTSTTKQIEYLRQFNNESHQQSNKSSSIRRISNTIYHHRNGIITNLYSELKKIMNTYSDMQSMRHRPSLTVLDNPYKVCSYPSVGPNSTSTTRKKDGGTATGGSTGKDKKIQMESLPLLNYDANDNEQLKELQRQKMIQGEEMELFMAKYNDSSSNIDVDFDADVFDCNYNDDDDDDDALIQILNQPLPSLPPKMEKGWEMQNSKTVERHNNISTNLTKIDEQEYQQKEPVSTSGLPYAEKLSHTTATATTPKSMSSSIPPYEENNNNNSNPTQNNLLEQETILLTHKIQNESLDSVQNVENQMIQITSLLNQFTSLIQDQHEDIDVIHETTVQSRDNVDKGNEQLLKAKENKNKGRHYFAWVIVIMGLILLFLNAIIA